MILTLWTLLIVLGFLFRNSKKLSIVQMLFMTVLVVNNVNNPDYHMVESSFNAAQKGMDIFSGNWLLKLVYYIVGLVGNYQVALLVISLLSFFLIYRTISYYTANTSYVFSLYMIASFVIDATQIKNFFAMAIWIYFSKFLFNAYKEKRATHIVKREELLKYVLGVFLATSVHVSFAVTIVFVLIVFIDMKTTFVLGGILILVSYLSPNIIGVLEKMAKQLSLLGGIFNIVHEKFIAYSHTISLGSVTTRLKLEIIFFVIITFILIYLKRSKYIFKELDYQISVDFMYSLNVIVLTFVPLMYFSTEFYRFQRNLLLIIYSVLANALVDSFAFKRIQKKGDIVISVVSLTPAFFYLLVDAIIWNYDSVFTKLFWII